MKFVFHPAMHVAEEKYGDAVLTRLPMRTIKTGPLPSHGEPRGAIWCEIQHDGRKLNVFTTHLGVRRGERLRQLETLLGDEWLGHADCRDRDLILMGDFNSIPSSPVFAQLARALVVAHPPGQRFAAPTFPSRMPWLRLDHVFHSSDLRSTRVEVDRSKLARVGIGECDDLLALLGDRHAGHDGVVLAHRECWNDPIPGLG